MPVPKRKRSRARRDKRFANKGIKVASFTACQNCNKEVACHQACKSCGFYKGIKVLTTKAERILKRGKQRDQKQQGRAKRAKQMQEAQALAAKAQEVTPVEEPKK